MRSRSPIAKLIALSLVLVLLTSAWTPAFAAQQGPSNADLETFRTRLTVLMQDLAPDEAARTDAMMKVQGMAVADLMILYNAYPKDGAFWEAPKKLKAFLKSDAAVSAMRAAAPAGAAMVAAGGPVNYADAACPKGFNYEALWVARDAELVADIVMEVIPEDFTTSIAYVVAAGAWAGLKATLFAVEQIYERWDDCETNKVFEKVDVPTSTRATQASVDTLTSSVESVANNLSSISAIRDKVDSLVAFAALGGAGGPVKLFTGTNFTGTSATVGTDDACMGTFFHNIGSVQVPPGATLIVYDGCSWQGNQRSYTANDSNVADDGWGPNGPGSFRIVQPPPAEPMATKSSVDTLSGKIDNLVAASGGGQEMRNLQATVSAAVPRKTGSSGPITLFMEPNFGGTAGVFQGDVNCLPGPFFVNSKSVQVPPGTTVTFFAACEFHGDSKTFTTDDTNLSDNKLANPNDGSPMFPAASMRIKQTQVPLADTIASQSSLDSLTAKVAALDTSGNGELAAKIAALQALIGAGGLSNLDASISSRASQTTVSGLSTNVSVLQSSLTNMQVSLESRASNLETAVAKVSTQASVDALASTIASVGAKIGSLDLSKLDLSKLDAAVSSRASQFSVDAIGPKVDAIAPRIDAIAPKIDALGASTAAGLTAIQLKVSALDTGKLDAATSTRASQTSMDAGFASLLGAVRGQDALAVQVVEIQKRKRYLVYVTVAGAPVSGAALARFLALDINDNKGGVAVDGTAGATIVEIAPGILDVTLNVPGGKTDAVAVTVTRGGMTGSTILQAK